MFGSSAKYHRESKVFREYGVRNNTFLEEWYAENQSAIKGRNIRITIEIEPSPEDRKQDRFEQEFEDDYS